SARSARMEGERVTARTSSGIGLPPSREKTTLTSVGRGSIRRTSPIGYTICVTWLPTYSPTLSDMTAQYSLAVDSDDIADEIPHDEAPKIDDVATSIASSVRLVLRGRRISRSSPRSGNTGRSRGVVVVFHDSGRRACSASGPGRVAAT